MNMEHANLAESCARALLDRADAEIGRLRAEVERLRLYERAVASLARQILCPPTTPEEMARDILRGENLDS